MCPLGAYWGDLMRQAFAMLAVLVAACDQKAEVVTENTQVADISMPAQEEADTSSVAEDPWSVAEGFDKMTDARMLQATSNVVGAANDLQVVVTCLPGKPAITYDLTGFNKDGEGVAIERKFFMSTAMNEVMYRVDTREPVRVTNLDLQYSNQTKIADRGTAWNGSDAARASELTLRIQFTNANETYTLDQTSNSFRHVVEPCLTAQQAVAKKAQEDSEAQQADHAAAEERREAEMRNGPAWSEPYKPNDNPPEFGVNNAAQ